MLLIVAPEGKGRATRIEVGYALEGMLTDAATKLIIVPAILPRFQAGDYPDGIKRGVEQIIEILSSAVYGEAEPGNDRWRGSFKKRDCRRADLLLRF